MTQLLEKVLTEVYKLPPEKQDTIAAVILEELEDERLWDKVFTESQDKLSELARKVRADIIVKPTITFTKSEVRHADRKCKAFSLRSKIGFPRVGNQIWVRTPQNLASERVYSRNCCSLKCKHIFGFYYKADRIKKIGIDEL